LKAALQKQGDYRFNISGLVILSPAKQSRLSRTKLTRETAELNQKMKSANLAMEFKKRINATN